MNIEAKAVIMTIVVFALFFLGMWYGVEKQERIECLKWQKEALEFSDYYLVGWQKEQCEHHNIKIDAPVNNWSVYLE